MFSIIKTDSDAVTVSVPTDVRTHQFTIKTDEVSTQGDWIFYTLADRSYVLMRGVDASFDTLRPIAISGVFSGFKIEAVGYDGVSFTVEYVGE